MAEPVTLQSPDVFQLEGEDFFTAFKFEVEKVIAMGMCGEIVLTKSLVKPEVRCVVKKFTLLDDMKRARNKKCFQVEVQLMQSFDHPFLTYCMIAGQCSEYLAICMEYYQRGSLDRYIGGLDLQLSELCVTQVACALRYLHNSNVVHLDVKLNNIFLDDDFNAILGDFGLAVKLLPHQQTLPRGKCGGTPCYFAPERRGAPADKELDPYKMDSYSLGVVLWTLVVEKKPSSSIDYFFETRKNRELPPSIRSWLLKLLKKDPLKRLSVAEFLIRLRLEGANSYVIDRC